MAIAVPPSPASPPPPPAPPPYRAERPPRPAPYRHPLLPGEAASTVGGGALALVATAALVAVALAVRSNLVFGLVVLAAIFVPIERLASLHPQKVLRAMWKTDVVHLLVNNILTTIGLVVVIAIPVVVLRQTLGSGVADAVRGASRSGRSSQRRSS